MYVLKLNTCIDFGILQLTICCISVFANTGLDDIYSWNYMKQGVQTVANPELLF